MELIRQYKGQLIITLVLFLIILAMPFNDYTERVFLQDEINLSRELKKIVIVEPNHMAVPGDAGPLTLPSNSYYFKKGTYEVVFNLCSQADGTVVEIVDPIYLNPDNTSGKTLASASLPAGEEQLRLSLTIEDYSQCIQFRIHTQSATDFFSIYLLSQAGLYKDPYIYAGLLLLASAILFIYRRRRSVRSETLALLAFAAVWSCLPLCFNWLFRGHDLYFHYARLFNLSEGLAKGYAFPIRIHPDMYQNFTYIAPIYYSEFFLYPFALLGLIGMSPIGCYKVLLICINFATAGLSYYSFSRLFRSRRLGLTAALLYTMSIYRFINLYTRAAVGELLATLFLPLLLLAMYQLFLGDSRKWLTAVLSFTALLQSHLVTTELAVGLSLLFGIFNIRQLKDRKRLVHICLGAVFTLLLNLWFILPLLDHMRFPVFAIQDNRNLSEFSPYLLQLFDPTAANTTGDALEPGSVAIEMPYSIGLVLLIGSMLFLSSYLRKKHKNHHFKIGAYGLLMGILCLYACSSFFPWRAIQRIGPLAQLGNIQFAFRLLPLATLFLCLSAAVGIHSFFTSRDSAKLLFIFCGVLCVYTSGNYFGDFSRAAETFVDWNDQMDHVNDTDALYLVNGKNEKFDFRLLSKRDASFLASPSVTLKDCWREGTDASFSYRMDSGIEDTYVEAPFNYYPYFRAYDSSGSRLETSQGEAMRLRIQLPDTSEDTITIHFELPGFYRAGDLISLVTLLLLISALIFRRSRNRRQPA